MVEVLHSVNAIPTFSRLSQKMVEVLHSLDAAPAPASTGGTGAWFKVLEGDIFTDRELVD